METNLPIEIKEQLLRFAERLPEHKRPGFLRNVVRQLGELTTEYPNTILFTLIGWVIGEMIDNALTIPLPFTSKVIELTGDYADSVLALAGGVKGFSMDRQETAARDRISSVIRQELRAALGVA